MSIAPLPRTASRLFGVVDGAQDVRILGLVQGCADAVCLYRGALDPEVAAAAPWLIDLEPDSALKQAWQAEGWARNWGILVRSPLSLEALFQGLAPRTEVMLPAGDVALFRFYDPRVFRNMIETCPPDELGSWFQDVEAFGVADRDGRAVVWYRLQYGALDRAVA